MNKIEAQIKSLTEDLREAADLPLSSIQTKETLSGDRGDSWFAIQGSDGLTYFVQVTAQKPK
jgi:hypothetical protein